VYSIGFISRFYCVAFFILCVCVCMCVCVWATLPDLNKMDGWMDGAFCKPEFDDMFIIITLISMASETVVKYFMKSICDFASLFRI